MSKKQSVRSQKSADSDALHLEVAPAIGPLRCPHCSGTGFRRETLHHLGRGTVICLALYILFSGVLSFSFVVSGVDLSVLLAVALSPLVLGAITVLGLLLFGGRFKLQVCRRCGYAFTFGEPSPAAPESQGDDDGTPMPRVADADDDQKIVL